MHEYSLCVALLEQVERVAREHRAGRVERILVRIGPLSGVETPLLERAWPLVAAGSLAEDAELVCEPAPVRVRCSRCGAETEVRPNRLLCGACGDWRTRLVSGDEMLLAQIGLAQIQEDPD